MIDYKQLVRAEMHKSAAIKYNDMTPVERELAHYENQRAFLRGRCPPAEDYAEWCKAVDAFLPPKSSP